MIFGQVGYLKIQLHAERMKNKKIYIYKEKYKPRRNKTNVQNASTGSLERTQTKKAKKRRRS